MNGRPSIHSIKAVTAPQARLTEHLDAEVIKLKANKSRTNVSRKKSYVTKDASTVSGVIQGETLLTGGVLSAQNLFFSRRRLVCC